MFSTLVFYLKVDQLGDVGVGDEHLMQQTTDETLHLPQVAEQASFCVSIAHAPPGSWPQASLFRFPWHGAPDATQQALRVGPQLLLFSGWQTHLQENLDSCAILRLNRNMWFVRWERSSLTYFQCHFKSCYFSIHASPNSDDVGKKRIFPMRVCISD